MSERRADVIWGALAAGLLVAQQVAGKTTRDAFFLAQHPARALPLVMMASSVLAVLGSLAVSRLLSTRPPRQVVPVLVGANAALLLATYVLAQTTPATASVLVYLLVASTGGVLMSGYWSMVNERFDPWTAKRLVGRLALGASLGGVLGGGVVYACARTVPVPTMLPLTAGLNVAALVCLVLFRGDEPEGSVATDALSTPLHTLRALPYLQVIALVVALSAGLEAMLDYVLKARASYELASGAEMTAFFASYHVGVGVIALLAQVVLTRGALEGLGLAGTVAVRPLLVMLTAGLGLLDPRLWSAVLARGGWDVSSSSVFRSGYELLYTPVPDRDKRAAKQVVDVGFDKVGGLLGGALVLAAVRYVDAPERALLMLAAGIGLLLVALTHHLHRGYVITLEQALHVGNVSLGPDDVKDSTTRYTLLGGDETLTGLGAVGVRDAETRGNDPLLETIADLRSRDGARVRRALRRPGRLDASLVPHLVPLVAIDELSLVAMRALRTLAAGSAGQIFDVVLDDTADPVVRRRLPRLFRGGASPRAVEGLGHGLDSESFEVRAACSATLARIARSSDLHVVPSRIFAVVGRELAERRSLDDARRRHVFNLLALVLEREPLRAAERALRGRNAVLRGTALEYLDTVLPREMRVPFLRVVEGEHAALPPLVARAPEELVAALTRADHAPTRARRALRPRRD